MPDIPIKGTTQEQEEFTVCYRHYEMAREDLDIRIKDFDQKDILFRSYIEKKDWPYRAVVFDPRVFTALYEKSARILANKPKGRLVPREGGDSIGAMINNELLNFQWDDNERIDGTSMLSKWALLDLNARKYGASFALVKWHWETQVNTKDKKRNLYYDGPNFRPLNNRDCLPNPSYSTIKNWFQHRDYLTLSELEDTNDAAKGKPIYKNLDILKDVLKQERGQGKGSDIRSSNYQIKNLTIKGLTDFLGRDEYNKVVEVITEYRPTRWVTFAPLHGIILRDIPNPYNHSQIPVVVLKYYPIDEDLYGLSEIEPIEKLQKAVNALVCQYLDAINMSLYAPLKVKKTGGAVQLHTLEFGPGKKWLMDNPASDVIAHEQNINGIQEFGFTYRFLIGAMQAAWGETSAGISNLVPGVEGKTATEIRDLASQRNARDNFNMLFLAEALKKQMMFWFKMNQQFLFQDTKGKNKIIRIIGKDAIKFFENQGLNAMAVNEDNMLAMQQQLEQNLPPEDLPQLNPEDFLEPLNPVKVGNETYPKFEIEENGQYGSLYIESEDLAGTYDYIPDIESMRLPDETQIISAKKQLLELVINPISSQLLAQDGYRVKTKEVFEDFFTQVGIKDAEKYFEKIGGVNAQIQGQPIQGGARGFETGGISGFNVQPQGMAGGPLPMAYGQTQPIIPGSI